MITGRFDAIAVSLNTLLDPGDEVIFISPPSKKPSRLTPALS
jgi:molybdopterin converting factor small subunit